MGDSSPPDTGQYEDLMAAKDRIVMINATKDRFLGSWPQRNINRPSKAIIPVDVEVAPIEEILQLQEAPRGEGEAA